MPRWQYEYGKILLAGMGITRDEKAGLKLLKASKMPEADSALMRYYYKKEGEKSNFKHYVQQAASHNDPDALYNLAIFEQEQKNYNKTVELLQKTLKADPNYEVVSFELARMYAEGWGVEKDVQKAISVFKKLAKQTKDTN